MLTGILQGEVQSPLKCLTALLWDWLPENTRPGWLVKQKPSCLSLGSAGSQTMLQRGEFAKQCPFISTHHISWTEKKSVVLVVSAFLSCDKFPADPGTLPVVLLPAWGLCWLSEKYFIVSWPPRCQLSACCVTLGAALCELQGAGTAAVVTAGTLLFRSTACLGIWHGGSHLKVTSNKKSD